MTSKNDKVSAVEQREFIFHKLTKEEVALMFN